MNVCLGNAGFNGSDVYFKHVLGSKRGQYVDESDDEQLLLVHGSSDGQTG